MADLLTLLGAYSDEEEEDGELAYGAEGKNEPGGSSANEGGTAGAATNDDHVCSFPRGNGSATSCHRYLPAFSRPLLAVEMNVKRHQSRHQFIHDHG